MSPVARRRAPFRRVARWSPVVLVAALLIFLPFSGRFLVRVDPLQKSDLILVFAGARVERWLEAGELYKEGWAPRIVLSPGPVEPIERQLAARGVVYPREGELARDALIAYGVPAAAVSVLPGGVDNTAQEAAAVARMLSGTGRARIIIVTSPYHTRRGGFAFRRALAGTNVEVIVRASRFSESEPSRWWRRRGDVRYVVNELPKLAAYALGLGE
jgi:uncharacterized SAM-binding protein YcdF (DUF218 family)